MQNASIAQRKNGERKNNRYALIQLEHVTHVDQYKQRDQKKKVDEQKYTHKEPHPRDIDIFSVRYLLFDHRLVCLPPPVNKIQVARKLYDDEDPEKYKYQSLVMSEIIDHRVVQRKSIEVKGSEDDDEKGTKMQPQFE